MEEKVEIETLMRQYVKFFEKIDKSQHHVVQSLAYVIDAVRSHDVETRTSLLRRSHDELLKILELDNA